MPKIKFEVEEYSIDTLTTILCTASGTAREIVQMKDHIEYFSTYFNALGAKRMLVEYSYVDQDYLEDYAGYYAGCFYPYRRTCFRLHFFTNEFSKDDFLHLLQGDEADLSQTQLQEGYIGFIVAKPLPETIIGRTALKTYPENPRYFPIKRTYHVSIFGIKLSVSSLAFQEQDRAASACATSALWSAFQGTGILFHHEIPSPIEITKAAFEGFPVTERALPSGGLTLEQMMQAIRNVGLQPGLVNVDAKHPTDPNHLLKGVSYAYLRAGVPILLVGELARVGSYESLGFHAGAITGYRVSAGPATPWGQLQIRLSSSKLEKLYVHDDQVGPFARMEFDRRPHQVVGQATIYTPSLKTSWGDSSGQQGYCCFLPQFLILPLDKSIRIPFITICEAVSASNGILTLAHNEADTPSTWIPNVVWDIFLTSVNEFKSSLLTTTDIDPDVKTSTLVESLPKYIWRATAQSDNVPILDLLFDSTDIDSGKLLAKAVIYRNANRVWLSEALKKPGPSQMISRSGVSVRKIFKKLGA